MSHNVKIEGVAIANMAVLARAVQNLAKTGINIKLDQCGEFRTYRGQPNKSEFTIHLPGARFDIGLNRNAKGVYEPVFDSDLSHSSPIACEFRPGDTHRDREANTIGKLMEEYSACLLEREAEDRGHSTQRQRDAKGQLQVVVEVD